MYISCTGIPDNPEFQILETDNGTLSLQVSDGPGYFSIYLKREHIAALQSCLAKWLAGNPSNFVSSEAKL